MCNGKSEAVRKLEREGGKSLVKEVLYNSKDFLFYLDRVSSCLDLPAQAPAKTAQSLKM